MGWGKIGNFKLKNKGREVSRGENWLFWAENPSKSSLHKISTSFSHLTSMGWVDICLCWLDGSKSSRPQSQEASWPFFHGSSQHFHFSGIKEKAKKDNIGACLLNLTFKGVFLRAHLRNSNLNLIVPPCPHSSYVFHLLDSSGSFRTQIQVPACLGRYPAR